jgi:hypothetical protein
LFQDSVFVCVFCSETYGSHHHFFCSYPSHYPIKHKIFTFMKFVFFQDLVFFLCFVVPK